MKKIAIIITSFILFVCGTAFMNDDDLDMITQKLQQYFEMFPAEKVYLHFSEDVWVAGEKVWCKAYLVNGNNLQLSTESKVMYADLRNRQGEIVQSLTLNTSSGIARGSFVLSDSLSNGWYQIHTYTQWMRNFEEESHFIRPVFVVNPLQEIHQNSSSKTLTANDLKLSILVPDDHLIAGKSKFIRLGVTHKTGEGIPTKGAIVTENDSLISPIQTNEFGIGSAQLSPEIGNRYFFSTVVEGDTVRYPLPPVKNQKIALEIHQQQTDAMQVKVLGLHDTNRSAKLYLLAVSGEKVVYTESLKLRSDQGTVELPYNLFHHGVGHIAIFNETNSLLDAKKVVIPHQSSVTVRISTDQPSYTPREKGQFTLALSDQQGNPLAAHASVSIRKANALSNKMPAVHIENTLFARDEKIDSFQSTHDFDWNRIMQQPLQKIHFPKETEGITISGKLLTSGGAPIGQEKVVLSVAGYDTWFQYDDTGEDGSFQLLIERVFGKQDVVIQAPEVDGNYQIVLDEDKNPMQLPALQFQPRMDAQALEYFIQQCQQRVKINDMYTFYQQDTSENTQPKKRQSAPFRFYGVPNMELYLEDYIDLPNMEEVCRELLPGVQLRIDGNEYDFDVFDIRTRNFLPDEPSLFVDGVLVFDRAQFAAFPPKKIEKIETINRPTFYGDFPFNGVVSLFSKAGDQYESMLPQDALQTPLSFFDKPESFASVGQQKIDKRTPDLRSLLYWNPDVKFNNKDKITLEFTHSDETGEFEIVVEGITSDGRAFSHVEKYDVVFQ